MPRRSTFALALSFSATLLCGCGGATESPRPAPVATAGMDKKHQIEAVKADCMKERGFKYVAWVQPKEKTEEERSRASGNYQAMRKYRQKYGFGIWSIPVYREEMNRLAGVPEPGSDPNMQVALNLSPTQQEAWTKARDTCTSEAVTQVLGLTVKSHGDLIQQMLAARKRAMTAELDGDPELRELTAAMSDCLRSKGYAVSDTAPTALAGRGGDVFDLQRVEINKKQHVEAFVEFTPQQARPYLNREIKAALDDLECGKDFYAAYMARESAIENRISDQFAFRP
ncbi:hypothetical protein ABGB18_36885 [Nonomuraea sp. B12E4]|uniref:hypothetical protein n=1 Tax=Nonomuraea sp. B12E4 TaxID=3153564 RepID=UPI00325DC10C